MAYDRSDLKASLNFNLGCTALTTVVSFLLFRDNQVLAFKFIWALMFLASIGSFFWTILTYQSELDRFDEQNPSQDHASRYNHLENLGVKEVKPFIPEKKVEK